MTAAVCTGVPERLDRFHAGEVSPVEGVQLGADLAGLGAEDFLDSARWPAVGVLPDLSFTNCGGIYAAGDDGWLYTVQQCGPRWFADHRNCHELFGPRTTGIGLFASMVLAQLACEAHRRQRRAAELAMCADWRNP